jgi:hypothetical protein
LVVEFRCYNHGKTNVGENEQNVRLISRIFEREGKKINSLLCPIRNDENIFVVERFDNSVHTTTFLARI